MMMCRWAWVALGVMTLMLGVVVVLDEMDKGVNDG